MVRGPKPKPVRARVRARVPEEIDPNDLLKKVADDDEVRARTKQLALCVLSEAEHLILEGNPSVKVTMIRSLMPTLAKTLEHEDEVSEVDLMRQEVKHLMDEIRGDGPQPSPQLSAVPADTADAEEA